MDTRIEVNDLQVDKRLYDFINTEALPGTGISQEAFWSGFGELIKDLSPLNRDLLNKRDYLQHQINTWYSKKRDEKFTFAEYKTMLHKIGYLVPEGDDFTVETDNVDSEISSVAGPQLVVPVTNARYALNAANARWGSLYDALYGTDVIPETDGAERSEKYNPIRGTKVIAFARKFLDNTVPLSKGSHENATSYSIQNDSLVATLSDGTNTELQTPSTFVGYNGSDKTPAAILLKHNGLHIEINVDHNSAIGKNDEAGVKDIVLEAAITTIMDLEDSVSTVDAVDKVSAYRNWLGLTKGDLSESFEKNGTSVTRIMNSPRFYKSANGSEYEVPGISLMLIRNVGHLMTNPAILDKEGNKTPEGLLDAMVSSMIAMHDLKKNKTAVLDLYTS